MPLPNIANAPSRTASGSSFARRGNIVDVPRIEAALQAFIADRQHYFSQYGRRETQLLELGALVMAVAHYDSRNYQVLVRQAEGGQFRVNMTARGHPWNFSFFAVERDGETFEIHGNLPVRGAYGEDGAVYVVDVAVVREGAVARYAENRNWHGIRNTDLV